MNIKEAKIGTLFMIKDEFVIVSERVDTNFVKILFLTPNNSREMWVNDAFVGCWETIECVDEE